MGIGPELRISGTLFSDGSLLRRLASQTDTNWSTPWALRPHLQTVSLHVRVLKTDAAVCKVYEGEGRKTWNLAGIKSLPSRTHTTNTTFSVLAWQISVTLFTANCGMRVSRPSTHLTRSQNSVFAYVAHHCRSRRRASLPERRQLIPAFHLSRLRIPIRPLPGDSVGHATGPSNYVKLPPFPYPRPVEPSTTSRPPS